MSTAVTHHTTPQPLHSTATHRTQTDKQTDRQNLSLSLFLSFSPQVIHSKIRGLYFLLCALSFPLCFIYPASHVQCVRGHQQLDGEDLLHVLHHLEYAAAAVTWSAVHRSRYMVQRSPPPSAQSPRSLPTDLHRLARREAAHRHVVLLARALPHRES